MYWVTATRQLLAGCLVCAFLGTFAAPAAAQSGYIVNAADPTSDGTHDNLWRVNLADGSSTRIGPLNIRANNNIINSDVEGLALESASALYGVDDAIDALLTISPQTGMAVPFDRGSDNLRLGMAGSPLDPGLAFDCDGNLLMSSATRRTLYRLGKNSGQATVIGREGGLNAKIADIAVRGDNVYGIGIDGDEGLYRIDAEAGTAQRIGSFGHSIRLANAGMDFDSSGRLWAIGHIVDGNGQPQPSRILKLDRQTGAVELGATTRTGVKSLAITPPRCGTGTPNPGPGGTGSASAVPLDSPWMLLLLTLGLIALAARQHLTSTRRD